MPLNGDVAYSRSILRTRELILGNTKSTSAMHQNAPISPCLLLAGARPGNRPSAALSFCALANALSGHMLRALCLALCAPTDARSH